MSTSLSEAQRAALSAFAGGARLTAAQAASARGIIWPASGNFGTTLRRLMKMGYLDFDSRTAEYWAIRATPQADEAQNNGMRD